MEGPPGHARVQQRHQGRDGRAGVSGNQVDHADRDITHKQILKKTVLENLKVNSSLKGYIHLELLHHSIYFFRDTLHLTASPMQNENYQENKLSCTNVVIHMCITLVSNIYFLFLLGMFAPCHNPVILFCQPSNKSKNTRSLQK